MTDHEHMEEHDGALQTVLGYKIFDNDWTCRGFQFPFGKQSDASTNDTSASMTALHNGPVVMCESGFHFCQRALDCLQYYPLDPSQKYAQVVASGIIVTSGEKGVTNELTLVKELTFEEFRHMCTGTMIFTYYNGRKQCEKTYKEGRLHGAFKSWHTNGGKNVETTYEEDMLQGSFTQWNKNAVLVVRTTYNMGRLNGPYACWHDTGTQAVQSYYDMGRLRGGYITGTASGFRVVFT
jgi:hypothetical protein